MRLHDDSGQVLPMVAVMTLGLLAMVGLVVDAGVMFAARRDLQSTADAAARAGAAVLDEDVYRSSGGRTTTLDEPGAEEAALAHLADVDVQSVTATSDAVFVSVSRSQPLLLLGLIGVGPVNVEARSTARPRTGILAPGG
ncbi:MAG: pilus assembly protein TadG-related protein [Thermoleophilaceae bacterium]